MIQCCIPNSRVVEALLASGYVCRRLSEEYHYETDAPLVDGVPFDCNSVSLKLTHGKVFPYTPKEEDWWVIQYENGEKTGKKAGPYTLKIAKIIACALRRGARVSQTDYPLSLVGEQVQDHGEKGTMAFLRILHFKVQRGDGIS